MDITRIDLPEDFFLRGCNSYVLCLRKEGDTEVISAKEKGLSTWLDAHVWIWIRNLFSCVQKTPAISYKFEKILSALSRDSISTGALWDILKGFKIEKYNTKHPQVREKFFRIFSSVPFFPKTFESFENAIRPGTLQTALTQFQEEVERLGQEFDQNWPERSWADGIGTRLGVVTDFDLLRGAVSNLQTNNGACDGNEALSDRMPKRISEMLQQRAGMLFREKEIIIACAITYVSFCKRCLTQKLQNVEAEFGRDAIITLRTWVLNVEQSCLNIQQAIGLYRAVHR